MSLRPALFGLGLISALALAIACAGIDVPHTFCTTDAECGEGAICFPDGCGDPGRDLKAQVTFGPQAQEFEITDLHATYDPDLLRPPFFAGQIRQDTSNGPVAFTNSVTFKAAGTALLLPAIPRRPEMPLQPLSGQYAMPVSTGRYLTLTAYSSDLSIPPVWVENSSLWSLAPGGQQKLDILFPAPGALVRISGTLLLSLALGPVPAPMQVQVLELNTGRPLSQPGVVDPLTGAFSVLASPKAVEQQSVEILASPRDAPLAAGTIIPNKLFTNVPVTTPFTPVLLELGDFGSAVTVAGQALDADGQPVAGATVYTERDTPGRANYRSGFTTTGLDGSFAVKALPTLTSEDGVSLWVVPPSGSHAGTLQMEMSVPPLGGPVGQLRCPRRVQVRGQVLRPAGDAPATGVNVIAEPAGGVAGRKPPTFSQQDTTDLEGRFSFWADPGEYQLDFHPPDTLPRVSRRVTVDLQLNPDPVPVEVPTFTLWNGRTLSGTVTGFATASAITKTALPGASVELFRVVKEGDKTVQYLLGKATTDGSGNYTLVLPTAPAAADAGTPDGG